MSDAHLAGLTALEAAERIAGGDLSAADYVDACLARIEAIDDKVHAFVHLDPEEALRQARALDERRRNGKPLGPLHGVPVAIKDIFDTADYPTECGSPLLKGRRPTRRLHHGGALTRSRRCDHRQDGDHRVRLFPRGRNAQSARSRAHARRLVVRLGGGGRRRHGAARGRLADQRLGDPAGLVLRRLRHQADARHHLAPRCAHSVQSARSRRCIRPHARRRRADPRRACRLRR